MAVWLGGCQDGDADDDGDTGGSTGNSMPGDDGDDGSADGVDSTGGSTTDSVPDTTSDDDTGTDSTSTGSEPCELSPQECAQEAEDATAAALEAVRDDSGPRLDFLIAMPLGGDLHHHLSGAVYAETYLGWAAEEDYFCINDGNLALSTSCGDGNDMPVPTGRRDLYLDVVRSWSMFEFVPSGSESGADHFFSTFGKFGALSGTRHGRMLADVRRRAAIENLQYIEPMLTSNSTARNLGEDTWQDLGGGAVASEDYPTLHAALLAADGFPAARSRLTDDADDNEAIADSELDCDTDQPKTGCDVVTRYQAYISRSGSDSGIFGQMVAAYEAAMVEPRIVGLNLVGPEDGSSAMANYDRLMAMLSYLGEYYDGVSPLRLSLHAGEITAESIPNGYQLDETQHIRKAVEVAGARRIGHGVDVMFENNPQELLDMLRDDGVLVEVCFASNDIILEVSGAEHPVHDYIASGVPVALATDDQGVARSSMAQEFARAVGAQGLDYYELKTMVRASIEYSFLQGESLWSDYGRRVVVEACAPADGDTLVTQPPSAECEAFLADSPRAEVQRALEERFEAFESGY